MNSLPNDEEIKGRLRNRTTSELVEFRNKLKRIDTPQAWAIRLHVLNELMFRLLMSPDPASFIEENDLQETQFRTSH